MQTQTTSAQPTIARAIPRMIGCIAEIVVPTEPRDDAKFFGFIVANEERFYFNESDLSIEWNQPLKGLELKVVTFEPVKVPRHRMRQAANVEIFSGAAA